ncbi:MAG: hypothetical protein JXB25_01190 [Deltaproteobacteria bacterium]|nr:hypothetical protein [Deltaproteobacteria bacterium]
MPRKAATIPEVKGGEVLSEKVARIDQELKIMDRHFEQLAATEEVIQEEMKKRDREYKDEHLHSVPKPRKHTR